MKRTSKILRLFLLVVSVSLIVFSISCDGITDPVDDDMMDDPIQLDLSVDEYPRSGNTLGTLTSTLTETVGYNLISQSVPLAFTINNGELRVADWLVFDYEETPTITAIVEATNGTDSEVINVTVTINDVDDIWAFLNDSQTAYENADEGDWIPIIESEYNDLANYLAETTKSGATDSHFASTASIFSHHGGATIANDNGNTLPAGSYLFAFKYYSWSNNVVSSSVKISEGDSGGPHMSIGSRLPEHNDEYNYFVLKGANSPLTSEGYLSMYASLSVGQKSITGTIYRWANGDVDNLDNSNSGAVYLHQGISSTLKQWD
ncbi:cadherin repeat domain-containing protein [Ekhidna sp.]|uniref:cadherin repeat domain-containing protein n=1 Tax=Ekhidna sp. TaxID=2608089 RepID=UPI003296EBD9